jgi:hypothetical protein
MGMSRDGGRSGVSSRDIQKRSDSASSPSLTTAERVALNAGSFEIVVKGRLSPTLIAAMDGFEVSRCDLGLTHLVGWVPDQSRLHGTLERLRDLNIELVSVNPMESPELQTHEDTGLSGSKGEVDA